MSTALPTLALTELDAIIVDPQGNPIKIHTLIQPPPPPSPTSSSPTQPAGYDPEPKIYLVQPIYGYRGWTAAQQSAFRVAIVLMCLIILTTLILYLRWLSPRKAWRSTYEQAYRERRARVVEAMRHRDLRLVTPDREEMVDLGKEGVGSVVV